MVNFLYFTLVACQNFKIPSLTLDKAKDGGEQTNTPAGTVNVQAFKVPTPFSSVSDPQHCFLYFRNKM